MRRASINCKNHRLKKVKLKFMKQGCTEIDGKFYQECDIVMLPTKEASKLYDLYGKLNISLHGDIYQNDGDKVPQHLYFLSDEETRKKLLLWKRKK